MWKQIISALTGSPVEEIGEYFKQRQQLKHELRLTKLRGRQKVLEAKANAAAARAEHLASWENSQIQNSGWKDEFALLTVSYPLYASFIPFLQDSVGQGFMILGTTPMWYMGIVVTLYLAVFGIRWKYATDIKLDRPGGKS